MPDVPGHYRPGCRRRPYRLCCKRCGRAFTAKRCTATWCSAKCRKAASRDRAAARAAELRELAANGGQLRRRCA